MNINKTKIIEKNPDSYITNLCYTIQIINDTIDEYNETFIAVLSSTSPNVRLQSDISTVTILADYSASMLIKKVVLTLSAEQLLVSRFSLMAINIEHIYVLLNVGVLLDIIKVKSN